MSPGPEVSLTVIAGTAMLGSVHCVAMCGGFVMACAPRRGLWRYHAGRLLAYAALGVVAGLLGQGLDLAAAELAGVQRAAGVVLGGVLVALAVGTLWPRGVGERTAPTALSRLRQRLFGRALRTESGPPRPHGFSIGLLSGLLPCGWLWSFVVIAAASGSPLRGLAVMGAFFVGTVPLLTAFGLLAGRMAVAGVVQRNAPRLVAVMMLAAGLLAVAGKLGPALEAPDAGGRTEICNHPELGAVP